MDIRQLKENKLKTILQFSIPSIIAMLLQTVITITDGYLREIMWETMHWQQSILDYQSYMFIWEQDFV